MALLLFPVVEGCTVLTKSTIISKHNRRIAELRKLHQRKHRRRQGRFLVESFQLLHLALDAGIHPLEVFFRAEQYDQIKALLSRFRNAGAELVSVSPDVMETLSDHGNPQSIVGTFVSFETPLHLLGADRCKLLIIVDRPQSPANLGMIFRTADAVGAGAVVIIEPCVEPLHPKALRVSLGTVFDIPFAQTPDTPGLFKWVCEQGLKPVGADPSLGRWDQEVWRGRIALILGSDVRGMSDDVRPWVRDWVKLPMMGKVESLSSAVAGSVLMYDWLKVNRFWY